MEVALVELSVGLWALVLVHVSVLEKAAAWDGEKAKEMVSKTGKEWAVVWGCALALVLVLVLAAVLVVESGYG
jgi:hypothetical protein